LGESHPLYLLLLGDYAGLLRHKGDLAGAEKAIRQAIELGRDSPLYWHPVAAEAILQLADLVLRERRDPVEAEKLYREALNIAKGINKKELIEKAQKRLDDMLRLQKDSTSPTAQGTQTPEALLPQGRASEFPSPRIRPRSE
jgi:tetratricopeptide (TPR) repeat protein